VRKDIVTHGEVPSPILERGPFVQANGEPYVAMRRIVENLGLDWSRQRKRLDEQQEKFMCGLMSTHDTSGHLQHMTAMPVSNGRPLAGHDQPQQGPR
jgi:hypothetical protein